MVLLSEEVVEEYHFYCFHRASFGYDRGNCPACDDDYEAHDSFDDTAHESTQGISCYCRQKYNAFLKPSTYRRLTDPENDETGVLYALVEVENGFIPNKYGLDSLCDDEMVVDASDDLYVVRSHGDKDQDAWSYFRQKKIHLCFDGSLTTEFAEWHDSSRHISN